ncbi:TolC family protein [Ekhidna sp.]|uniref:TolC family protein n=1 Tax=Ekhidna sp. TaxID=2608089 RepID=UPI0032EBA5FC
MKVFFLIHCLLVTLFTVKAQVDVTYFIEQGIQKNPTIADAKNQVQISTIEQERIKKEVAATKVFLTGDVLFAPYFNNKSFIDTSPNPNAVGYDINISNGGLYSALINASQPIFTKKILEARTSVETANQQKLRANQNLFTNDLKKQITDQYIRVLLDQEMVAMNQKLLSDIEDQTIIITRLADAGILKRSDVLLIELEQKTQTSAINTLINQWHQGYFDLTTICGIKDTVRHQLTVPVFTENDSVSSGSKAFFQAFRADSLSVLASVSAFESAYVPTVSVYGNAGLNAANINNANRNMGLSAGLTLSLPVYDGKQRNLNLQKNKVALNTIQQYRSFRNLEIENNKKKLLDAIQRATENVAFLEKQSDDYQTLLRQYQKEIQVGQLSIVDYINGLKFYKQAQINLINTRINLLFLQSAYTYWNW